jgi:hypothetical protein
MTFFIRGRCPQSTLLHLAVQEGGEVIKEQQSISPLDLVFSAPDRGRPERDEGLPRRRRSSRLPDSRTPGFRRPATPIDEHGERSNIQETKAPRRSVEARTFKPDLEWRPFSGRGPMRILDAMAVGRPERGGDGLLDLIRIK